MTGKIVTKINSRDKRAPVHQEDRGDRRCPDREWGCATPGEEVESDGRCTRSFAHGCDRRAVPSEIRDVMVDPFESQLLVVQSHICGGAFAVIDLQESEDVEPVIGDYDHNVTKSGQEPAEKQKFGMPTAMSSNEELQILGEL